MADRVRRGRGPRGPGRSVDVRPRGRGHHGHAGISAFWEKAIAPIDTFEFRIDDSFANPGSNTCANIGRIKTSFADGSHTTTDLIMVYVVDDDGRVKSMKAFWEPSARWPASPPPDRPKMGGATS